MKIIYSLVLASVFASSAFAQAPAAPAKNTPAAAECKAAKGAEAKFAAVDKNKDGVISKAEAQATRGCGALVYMSKKKVDSITKADWMKNASDKAAAKGKPAAAPK